MRTEIELTDARLLLQRLLLGDPDVTIAAVVLRNREGKRTLAVLEPVSLALGGAYRAAADALDGVKGETP